MRHAMATLLTETSASNAAANGSPSRKQQSIHRNVAATSTTTSSFLRNSPLRGGPNGNVDVNGNVNDNGDGALFGIGASLSLGGSAATGFIRRATSADDHDILSGSERSRRVDPNNATNGAFRSLHPSSPWSTFHDIFRARDEIGVDDEAARRQPSRHLSSGRLRSRDLDPMLTMTNDDGDRDSDDEEERRPQDRLGGGCSGIFRRDPPSTKLYSPIIGTPPRWTTSPGGGRAAADADDDTTAAATMAGAWIPSIRPSLSCPSSVFESPLFSSSGSHGALHALAGVPDANAGSSGARPPSGVNGGVGPRARAAALLQPYRLEKIISASADPSQSLDMSDENGLIGDDEGGLENVDVSVIECDEDDSPFRVVPDDVIERVNPHNHSDPHNPTRSDGNNPMRNLSDAFEMLVVDGTSPPPGHGKIETAPNLPIRPDARAALQSRNESDFKRDSSLPHSDASKGGETNSTTKPSPTSVLGFEDDPSATTRVEPSAASALRLENGLTVASVAMPHFHLHDSLRRGMCQGLVDRVSFYSVVRDINKEASDAAATDPRGGAYNDGTVHGKRDRAMNPPAKIGASSAATPLLPPANGKHQVVAEDGKVHVHPDPKEERRSVLVMACLSDERYTNPNDGPSMEEDGGDVAGAAGPSLGAALLDEEWWLMSAIASRAPAEVAANRSSGLLPTFYEAMGEKDANAGGAAGGTADAGGAGQSSRTQLWKPGRSWWEAKSGKNPWVEPVVHNNRWRYLWPLIHYHKFIAKCIKKLKRNSIDVKHCTSNVSLFLRQEVCNVSDHLAFMSKYDSEEWTSALSHFDCWTDHDPTVEETLRTLVASQQLAGVADTADVRSSLLRSQIDDKILRAMQAAKQEAGKDAYDYKDLPKEEPTVAGNSTHSTYSRDNSFGNRTAAWENESHLRSAIESKKRTINDTSWSNRSGFHAHPPSHPQEMYARQFGGHPPPYGPPASEYGQAYGGSPHAPYYPPPHPHHQYAGYHGQYPPHHSMGYHQHPDMSYNDQYGHHPQYYNGYYHPTDGSFHEGMVLDNSMLPQDPYLLPSSVAQTPNRYQGGDIHHNHGHYSPSPYWEHLHLSQLPGIAASPSIHVTPSRPPRGHHPNRSFRMRPQYQQGAPGSVIDGKAKSLIMFPNQTNSPASRFVMSPQDKTNPYYNSAKTAATTGENGPVPSSSALNQSVGQEESFVLPTIEDYSPESPADKAAGHASVHSNTSIDMMPPNVKKMYTGSRQPDPTLSEVLENP